jgi:hypothetical protein
MVAKIINAWDSVHDALFSGCVLVIVILSISLLVLFIVFLIGSIF